MTNEVSENQEKSEKPGKMTVEEAGRLGGNRTRDSHDNEFYRKIGKKGGMTRARQLRENGISAEQHVKFSLAGRKGGITTKTLHGTEFYEEIGRKGGSVPRKKS